MMICTQCGFQNETEDAFCGSCGAFLEWAGEQVRTDDPASAEDAIAVAGTATPTDTEDTAASETVIDVRAEAPDRNAAELGAETTAETEGDEAIAAAARAPLKVDARAGAVVTEPGQPPAQAQPSSTPTRTQTTAARPPGGQPGQGPVARRPDDVKLASPRTRPQPTKPPPKREIRPGDLICGECQEGNDPDRRFCRRCGASLIEAKEAEELVVLPVPWWKRPFIRQSKVMAAGERPMRRGGSHGRSELRTRLQRATRVTAVVMAVVAAVGYIGPWRSTVNGKISRAFSGAREKVAPKLKEIAPAGAEADPSLPGHPPAAAVDRVTNTYWAEGAPGNGEGQRLIVTFDHRIRLGKIGFSLGASTKPEDFATEPRPKEVVLHFSKGSKKLNLKEVPDFQQYDLDVKDTDRVVIEIVSVSKPPQSGSDCSIAEVEFWERS